MIKACQKILANERGIILVISLLILALLMGAGVGAFVSMQTDLKTSGNLKTGTQAFYIADAGINHARREMQDGTNDFDSVFKAADGPGIVSNNSFNGGTYTVTRQKSAMNPSRVKVLAVGTAPNNARVEIEVWFRKDAGRPSKAVESNGDLRISGNPNFIGSCGGAHANEDMQIDGSPRIQIADGLTASNQTVTNRGLEIAKGMDIKGTPCVGSLMCSNPPELQPDTYKLNTAEKRDSYISGHNSEPLHSVPKINPADYAPKVAAMESAGNHYILNNNGTVTSGGSCKTDGLCTGRTSVDVPSGWSFSAGTWKVTGKSAANGVFYSESKVEISGSPGSTASPWQATIIARDSIRISGNIHIQPYPTTSEDLQNHLLVTGNDLIIEGNMHANYANGAILVHQQVEISGTPGELRGFIIAGDGQPSWNGDPFPSAGSGSGFPGANPAPTMNKISGNPSITYSCDFGCLGPGCPSPKVGIASWTHKF